MFIINDIDLFIDKLCGPNKITALKVVQASMNQDKEF